MLKNNIKIFIITLCLFIFPMQDGNTAEDDGLSSLEVVEAPQQTKSDTEQNGLYEPQNKAQALMKSGETPYNKQTVIDGGDDQGQIKQLQVTSENTIEGSITAKGKSEVSIGSTHLGEKKDGGKDEGANKNPGIIGVSIEPNLCPKTGMCQSENCSKINGKGEKEKCHIIDGCSGPAGVPQNDSWSSLFAVFGKPEDCCSEPDKIYPCNQHDRCYQTCNKNNSQEKCDKALLNDMLYACDHNLLSNIKDIYVSDSSIFNCKAQAKVFYSVLSEKRLGMGREAWEQRQTQFGCNKHE